MSKTSEEKFVLLVREAIQDEKESLNFAGSATFTLSKIPEGHLIKTSAFLKELNISYNQLQVLPSEIKLLSQLDTLDVSRNRIRSFREFDNFPSLRHLNVSHNQIRTVSFDSSHRKILSLDFSYNRITTVEGIENLSDIYALNLDFNGISTLPDTFSALHKLNKLSISANLLREVPSSFSDLSLLTELNISHNKISYLPEFLSTLPNITLLQIDGNPIKEKTDNGEKWKSNLGSSEGSSPRSNSVLGKQRTVTPVQSRHKDRIDQVEKHVTAPVQPKQWEDVNRLLNRSARSTIAPGSLSRALGSYESLLSLDVRSNLLLRAVRVRLDCRESLELLRTGGAWILLPPNITLSDYEINSAFVAEHVITFTNHKQNEFVSQAGNHGFADFQNNTIDIRRTNNASSSGSTPLLQHHYTFEIIEHGRVTLERSDFMCILINDVVTTNSVPFAIPQTDRTFEQFLEELTLNKRRRFEGKIERFVKNFRRDIQSAGTLSHANPSVVMEEEITRNLKIVLDSSLFSSPLPKKREITKLRSDIRCAIMKPLYNILFKHVGSFPQDKELTERIKKLQWIEFTHLELPFAYDTLSGFEDCVKNLTLMHKAICPYQKLQFLLTTCRSVFEMLTKAIDGEDIELGADQFLPSLIYVIIRANPPNLWSNLQYIETFCSHKNELCGEAAYYHTNVLSCIRFLEHIRAEDLKIQPEEFARKMAQNDSLPPIHTLHFVHHTIQDIHVAEINDLLEEYQKLATWYIATIDKNESVSLQVPQTRLWGQLKARTKGSELNVLLRIPSRSVPFSYEWLRLSMCTKLKENPNFLIHIVWLPDVIISDDSDCSLLWECLFGGNDVALEGIFSSS